MLLYFFNFPLLAAMQKCNDCLKIIALPNSTAAKLVCLCAVSISISRCSTKSSTDGDGGGGGGVFFSRHHCK